MLAWLRLPGPELERAELSFRERAPIDIGRALEQHAAYRELLAELGCTLTVLPALQGHPDAVFVEDLAVFAGGGCVLARPGVESRRGEIDALARFLERDAILGRIEAPATLEGGDVLPVDDVLWVGQSGRTNHAGLKALAHLCLDQGLRVKAVGVHGCLHLRTGLTWLGRDTLLANPDWIDLERLPRFDCIRVDPREPFGASGVKIGATVVLSASHPRTAERLSARGFDVRLVDISEFEKAEGGPSCLSLRLWA